MIEILRSDLVSARRILSFRVNSFKKSYDVLQICSDRSSCEWFISVLMRLYACEHTPTFLSESLVYMITIYNLTIIGKSFMLAVLICRDLI